MTVILCCGNSALGPVACYAVLGKKMRLMVVVNQQLEQSWSKLWNNYKPLTDSVSPSAQPKDKVNVHRVTLKSQFYIVSLVFVKSL